MRVQVSLTEDDQGCLVQQEDYTIVIIFILLYYMLPVNVIHQQCWNVAFIPRGGGGGGRTRYIEKVGMLVENFEIDP